MHDRRPLQGARAQGSGLPGRHLRSRVDGHRRSRRARGARRRSRGDSEAGGGRKGRHSVQVLLSSARPKQEDLQRGIAEGQPSRERVLDQHALRQLRADPAAVGQEEEPDNEGDDPRGPGQDGGEHQGGADHKGGPALLREVQAEAARVRRLLQPHPQVRPRGAQLQPPPLLLRHRRGPHLHPEQGPGKPGSEVVRRRLQGVSRIELPHSRQAEPEVQPHHHRAHRRDAGDFETAVQQ